jgi:hypothetical protein
MQGIHPQFKLPVLLRGNVRQSVRRFADLATSNLNYVNWRAFYAKIL